MMAIVTTASRKANKMKFWIWKSKKRSDQKQTNICIKSHKKLTMVVNNSMDAFQTSLQMSSIMQQHLLDLHLQKYFLQYTHPLHPPVSLAFMFRVSVVRAKPAKVTSEMSDYLQ